MARPLVSDELWELIEPLIPNVPRRRFPGRRRLDDRKVLTAARGIQAFVAIGCSLICFKLLNAEESSVRRP